MVVAAVVVEWLKKSLTLLGLEIVDVATVNSDLTVFNKRDHAAEVWLQHLLNELVCPR